VSGILKVPNMLAVLFLLGQVNFKQDQIQTLQQLDQTLAKLKVKGIKINQLQRKTMSLIFWYQNL
jgi:hypothetical protein